MKCTKCGCELYPGQLFCEKCGQDAQLVPTYDLFDDELADLVGNRKPMSAAKKKKVRRKRNFAIIATVFAVSIVIVTTVIIYTAYINSFAYHMKQAEAAYRNNYMLEAIKEYKQCVHSNDAGSSGNSLYRAYLGLGKSQYAMAEYADAEDSINNAIALYPTSVEAYECLLDIYTDTKNDKQINYLKATITDPSILKVINTYYVGTPVFSKTPGDYDNDLRLFLSTNDGSTILYTLNGSDPCKSGREYKGAILLSEGRTIVSAVCRNSSGKYGQVLSLTYNIKYPEPVYPILSPDGGEFNTPTMITINVPTGCKAYYLWGDGDPKENGTLYKTPIPVEEGNNVLSVIVVSDKGKYSDVYRSNYKFYEN